MNRYAISAGEPLAISRAAIQRDGDGFFFMMGPGVSENEVEGSVVVVNVRGALSHFKSDCGDSYEAIVERVGAALGRKPSAVVLRIDSPGGVVAGLNETVKRLRKMSRDTRVPLIAYIDETAASAAFALACACEERLAPPSAVVGSIGVISTMASRTKADAKEGLEFVLITSGTHKADGHPHAPIGDDAVAAERGRNEELAAQFFAIVSEATGVSVAKLDALEAAIFLGKAIKIEDARDVGLIDEVISFGDAVSYLDTGDPLLPSPSEGNVALRTSALDNTAEPVSLTQDASSLRPELRTQLEDEMSVKLQALVAKMAKESDPVKVTALLAEYGMLAKSEKPDDDDEGDDEGDEESKAKKAAKKAEMSKKKAEAAGHKAKADDHRRKAAESDEKARKCLGDDDAESDEESKAMRAELDARLAQSASSGGAIAALADRALMNDETLERVAKLERDAAAKDMRASIHEALSARRITRTQATMLVEKAPDFVRDYLAMHPKAIVSTEESHLAQPDPRENADISTDAMAGIDQAVAALPASLTAEQKSKIRQDMINGRRQVAAKNGTTAPGRY